ncbi:aldo/keto reductase [Actinomadura hibisca]|uniref:aldo/keto reductase n=1 Tax=Actinomadura hibisca TaxID=68565 RepID=UPI00082E2971|nr:aldo/keto reductase [Actinomadura hibisca]
MTAIRRLGIGLAALGRPAYINLGRAAELPSGRSVDEMRSATWDVLDTAYAAGIRWIDAARSYGRSEEFLGGWLADRGQRDVTVSSKWGYAYVGDWRMDADIHEVKEHSLSRFREQYAQTRQLLGDRLDVYQVHSLTADSPLFEDAALRESLAQAAENGLRIGFSTSGPRQGDTVRRALDLEVSGQRLFSTVQSTWNVLEPSVGTALREAHENGVHVLVKEVLANGRLAVRPPRALQEVAERYDVGADAVAIAAALARPWAGTILLGAVSPGQLRANLQAADLLLDKDDLDGLGTLRTEPARYWADRSDLPWS